MAIKQQQTELTFIEKLVIIRRRHQLTQEQMADALGVKYNRYRAWELGQREPNEIAMSAIGRFLETHWQHN